MKRASIPTPSKSGSPTRRVGQKNKIARRWAKRGTERPERPTNRLGLYILGAICPKDSKGAALVMPRCDTEAMNLHLGEIATQIAPGAHAALLVDQAGWRLSAKPIVPPNITLIPLPTKRPELNPQENNSCPKTGSRTGSSNPSTPSSTTGNSQAPSSFREKIGLASPRPTRSIPVRSRCNSLSFRRRPHTSRRSHQKREGGCLEVTPVALKARNHLTCRRLARDPKEIE